MKVEGTGKRNCYQLSLLTPGSTPLEANSRKAILDSRVNWYTPRPRPVSIHLFLTRVIDPLRDSPCSLCVEASLSVAGRERLLIVNLSPFLFNSSRLYSCLRLLSLLDWLIMILTDFGYTVFSVLIVFFWLICYYQSISLHLPTNLVINQRLVMRFVVEWICETDKAH